MAGPKPLPQRSCGKFEKEDTLAYSCSLGSLCKAPGASLSHMALAFDSVFLLSYVSFAYLRVRAVARRGSKHGSEWIRWREVRPGHPSWPPPPRTAPGAALTAAFAAPLLLSSLFRTLSYSFLSFFAAVEAPVPCFSWVQVPVPGYRPPPPAWARD